MRAMLLIADVPAWVTDYPMLSLLAGLVVLVVGAEVLVRGAVGIALTVGMSRMAVGLTLVSIGTSLPELLVTLTAANSGEGGANLGMANVIGSNVANVLLIIGVAATIRGIRTKTRWLELGYLLLLSGLACIPFMTGARLDRWLAGLMLAVLALFLYQLLARERVASKLLEEDISPKTTALGWLVNIAMLGAGFAMLKFGAEWLVGGASQIATDMGMSTTMIGATVVAIGTSMPELATSAVAALRGQSEICIGNVIGSNIFNIGAVLGGAGMLHPFEFEANPLMLVTIGVATVSTLVLAVILRKGGGVPRSVGLLFLLAYGGYMTYAVMATQSV
ncbi:MAG: cation:H+ antiporter [Planctomycetota bacterium]|jgi:cation:H+ antiporter